MKEKRINELFKIAVFIPGIWKSFIKNILHDIFNSEKKYFNIKLK